MTFAPFPQSAAASPETGQMIAVGICTYRRPHLATTLASLAGQVMPRGTCLLVIVADNDETPSASGIVQAFTVAHSLPVLHVHCPSANISLARNAALETALQRGIRHLAFLDDDEVASISWLSALWRQHQDSGADVTLGPVLGVYGVEAPVWMARSGLHDTRPDRDAEGRPTMGYSGNVLLDLEAPALRGLRFDLARGRTGGEDYAYFHTARQRGATFAYAPEALAEEEVPAARARLGWLLLRRYRMGQTHASLSHPASAARRAGLAALALAKVAGSVLLAGPALLTRAGRARTAMRAALHCGVFSAQLGAQQVEPYAPSPLSSEVKP